MYRTVICICVSAIIFQTCLTSDPFQVCKRSDPNFETCLKLAIESALILLKKGLPEYGIPSIQPINVGAWVVSAKPPLTYDQQFKNTHFYNYHLSIIKNLTSKIDDTDFFLGITAHNPDVICKVEYKFENAIINGEDLSSEGHIVYVYDEVEFNLNFTGTIVKKGGERYVEITQVNMDIISMEKFSVDFRTKDPDKMKKLNKFYHDNAQYIVATEKELYTAAYSNIFKNLTNNIFAKFSFDKVFPS